MLQWGFCFEVRDDLFYKFHLFAIAIGQHHLKHVAALVEFKGCRCLLNYLSTHFNPIWNDEWFVNNEDK